MTAMPPYGVAEPVSARVRRVLAHNPSMFTFTGTGTYLVGAEELAVIDPGPDDPDHLDALLAAIGSARVTAILVTHTHRDHSPLAPALAAATGAPILGCAPLGPQSEAAAKAEEGFDRSYAPDRVLADGESVTGADWTLTAVHTPGHTSNHLCYALPQEQALFTGDHVMGWSTTVIVPPDGSMAAYMASLAKLQARDDQVFYPTHGPAIERPQSHLRGLILHRRQREAQVLAALAAGPQRIADLVPRLYAAVDPALWPAAGLSVEAHLIDLAARGRVLGNAGHWSLT